MKRLTQRDLAEKAGVHVTTVSLALRNHPRIPAETREKIQKLAKSLGYTADPALTSLVSHRFPKLKASKKVPQIIGYVTAWPTRQQWMETEHHAHQQFYHGAEAQILKLGFSFEHFWLREPGFTAKKWIELFHERNVMGLIFAPMPTHYGHISIDLSKLHVVSIDHLVYPRLHNISPNQYQALKLAFRKCFKHGYRRIALACSATNNSRVEGLFASAYFGSLLQFPEAAKIDPFLPKIWEKKTFLKWLHKTQPECVITLGHGVYEWLKEEKFRIPQEVGIVHLDRPPIFPEISGIDQNHFQGGITAANMVYSLYLHNERGVPTHPQTTLEDCDWIEGKTVRRVSTHARESSGFRR